MKIFDVHSHWGTRRGYPLRSEAELALQKTVWNSEPHYQTEEEMANYFRAHGVKVILDLGFTKYLPLDEVRACHDYALATQARYSDVVFGLWLQIHPKNGDAGVIELERCMTASKGFVGYMVVGAGLGHPCDDPIYAPYYDVSEAANRPVLILVGIDAGDAIENALDRAQPTKRAVVHSEHVQSHRLRDGEEHRAIEKNLKPAVRRHQNFSGRSSE